MKQITHPDGSEYIIPGALQPHSQPNPELCERRLRGFIPNLLFFLLRALEIWLCNLMITGDEPKNELNKITSACFVMRGRIFQI